MLEMSDQLSYDTMSVKELKDCIVRGGLSFDDCREKSELRRRAREADAAAYSSPFPSREAGARARPGSDSKSGDKKVKARKKDRTRKGKKMGVNDSSSVTEEETELLAKVQALVKESSQVVSGRDASAILAEAEELKETIAEACLTKSGRKMMQESLKTLIDDLAFEGACEKYCGRVLQIGILGATIVPLLMTLLESILEVATRPAMVVVPTDLTDMHAVVTGGCGAIGLELAILLAKASAGMRSRLCHPFSGRLYSIKEFD
eukprot:SAG11_NODE_172_length_13574_cov_14.732690_16_plen_262_part_00